MLLPLSKKLSFQSSWLSSNVVSSKWHSLAFLVTITWPCFIFFIALIFIWKILVSLFLYLLIVYLLLLTCEKHKCMTLISLFCCCFLCLWWQCRRWINDWRRGYIEKIDISVHQAFWWMEHCSLLRFSWTASLSLSDLRYFPQILGLSSCSKFHCLCLLTFLIYLAYVLWLTLMLPVPGAPCWTQIYQLSFLLWSLMPKAIWDDGGRRKPGFESNPSATLWPLDQSFKTWNLSEPVFPERLDVECKRKWKRDSEVLGLSKQSCFHWDGDKCWRSRPEVGGEHLQLC